MPVIPLTHLEFGDAPIQVRVRWRAFKAAWPPGTSPERVKECSRAKAQPIYFARDERKNETLLRPNLLSSIWWEGGYAERQNKVAPRVASREGVHSA